LLVPHEVAATFLDDSDHVYLSERSLQEDVDVEQA
jgi:hypothetical protein